jgi:acyl dehydratase
MMNLASVVLSPIRRPRSTARNCDNLKRRGMTVKGVKVEVGQRASYERTFTESDIREFAEISGDKGVHHVVPDSEGRIMVQGLLTATLPSKLGGDINYIARRMEIDFLRPVFAGDTVKAEAVITSVEPGERVEKVSIRVVCVNQGGKEVLTGDIYGVIRV